MKNKVKYILLSLLILVLMTIATKYNFKINDEINNKNSWWALVFQVIAELPIYLGLLFSGVTLFHITKDKIKNMIASLTYFFTFLTLFMPLRYLLSMNFVVVTIIILISIIVFLCLIKLSYKVKKQTYEKLSSLAIVCGIGIITELLVVTLLKFTWSRVRYDEIGSFTNWYEPNWFEGGHTSFPSGHTAGANNILYLSMIPVVLKVKDKQTLIIKVLCVLFIVLTAYSRMVLGRHYLSDVVIGFTVSYVIHKIFIYVLKHRHSKLESI